MNQPTNQPSAQWRPLNDTHFWAFTLHRTRWKPMGTRVEGARDSAGADYARRPVAQSLQETQESGVRTYTCRTHTWSYIWAYISRQYKDARFSSVSHSFPSSYLPSSHGEQRQAVSCLDQTWTVRPPRVYHLPKHSAWPRATKQLHRTQRWSQKQVNHDPNGVRQSATGV